EAADRRHADWRQADWRQGLRQRGITPCIPPRANRRLPASYCKALYKQRQEIENMLARLKDWRRISMPYDRRAPTFFSAILHRRNRHLLDQPMRPDPSHRARRGPGGSTPPSMTAAWA